ncbi:hypothetical protein G6F62_015683 [Rhizopus arrhizus]|nr:hypothetical protein G6F62_015683 [Rhizopus arrhizus]
MASATRGSRPAAGSTRSIAAGPAPGSCRPPGHAAGGRRTARRGQKCRGCWPGAPARCAHRGRRTAPDARRRYRRHAGWRSAAARVGSASGWAGG